MAESPNERDPFGPLVAFTRRYHLEFDKRIQSAGRTKFPFHGDATPLVSIIKAADGYVVFYLPQAPSSERQVPVGYHGFDCSEDTLNRICQSLSVHRLQVASPQLGKPWLSFPPIAQEEPIIPNFTGPLIQQDVRDAAKAGILDSLQVMTVTPIVNVEQGIAKSICPARVRIWSPVFAFPSLGTRRLFLWPYADLWWSPDQLDISQNAAVEAAESDFIALRTLLAAVDDQLAPSLAQNDAGHSAADILERQCDEFADLVETSGEDEEKLHQWLYQRSHWIFLDAAARKVLSKVPFGAQISDFVIERTDATYLLIELEAATSRIFRKDNWEPSAQFNHARQQVKDWQRYIADNAHTVRTEVGLTDIYQPKGAVVIGRASMIGSHNAEVRWRALKAEEPSVLTYDDIVQRVRALASSLRHIIPKTGS